MGTSPLLTADGVDKMYNQLAEIHAITVAQIALCAHWRRSYSTPSSPSIMFTHTQALSCSIDRSRPLEGYKLHTSSSDNNASHTSRYESCR
jgi:hypothetical protein